MSGYLMEIDEKKNIRLKKLIPLRSGEGIWRTGGAETGKRGMEEEKSEGESQIRGALGD